VGMASCRRSSSSFERGDRWLPAPVSCWSARAGASSRPRGGPGGPRRSFHSQVEMHCYYFCTARPDSSTMPGQYSTERVAVSVAVRPRKEPETAGLSRANYAIFRVGTRPAWAPGRSPKQGVAGSTAAGGIQNRLSESRHAKPVRDELDGDRGQRVRSSTASRAARRSASWVLSALRSLGLPVLWRGDRTGREDTTQWSRPAH